jgi:hypothetical protein
MKNRIYEGLKILFASPETIFTALIFLFYLLFNGLFKLLGDLVLKTPTTFDLLNYFIGGSLLFSITYSWKILKPKDNNKKLYEWEDYWKIKTVVYISLAIILSCNILYYITNIFRVSVKPATLALVLLIVILNPIITIVNLFLAAFKINEIIDETS